jgi:hypothetical protein
MVKAVLGDLYDKELSDGFELAERGIFSYMEAVSRSTRPEYLKTLTAMSDMSRLTSENFQLIEGLEYSMTERGEKAILVLAARAAYNKYSSYTRSMGSFPFYAGSQDAFLTALADCPFFLGQGTGTRNMRVDTVELDLEGLLKAGMAPFVGKIMNL